MIKANLPTFFVILFLMAGILWLLFGWSYGSVIAIKNTQIELQDRRLAEYKDKLSGATPDQAKARIDALEARLAAVEPRRLTAAQRASMIARLSPPTGATPIIAIVGEASGDSSQFAVDFVSVFQTVGGWKVQEGSAMGLGNRPASGIALTVANMNAPEAYIVANALRAANIDFDMQQGPIRDGIALEMLICTKLAR